MEHLILRYTAEEKREIERRWLEAKIGQIRAYRRKFETLEDQVRAIEQFLHLDSQDK